MERVEWAHTSEVSVTGDKPPNSWFCLWIRNSCFFRWASVTESLSLAVHVGNGEFQGRRRGGGRVFGCTSTYFRSRHSVLLLPPRECLFLFPSPSFSPKYKENASWDMWALDQLNVLRNEQKLACLSSQGREKRAALWRSWWLASLGSVVLPLSGGAGTPALSNGSDPR